MPDKTQPKMRRKFGKTYFGFAKNMVISLLTIHFHRVINHCTLIQTVIVNTTRNR